MKTLAEAISSKKEKFRSEKEIKGLQAAIKDLPEDEQKVLFLHFTSQLPVSEISKLLNCSQTTTYNKLNRALITLRHKFNPAAYEMMYNILYPEKGKPTPVE